MEESFDNGNSPFDYCAYPLFKGFQTVTANRAGVLGYLEPVSAILFSMIFLNEIPHLYSFFGGVLILFSGYLTIRGKV